jgi:iron(II)-dependent oxidoreductase
MAKILDEIGADGFNGDTMTAPAKEYYDAGQALSHPIAIEPEVGFGDDLAALSWTPFNWGYWMDYQTVPGVDRYKWLQSKHRTHVCDRWAQDRTDELQYAWFNGQGYESWENIWGIWNGITPRDAAVIQRIADVARTFSGLLTSPDWEPHTPTLQKGVYASRFPGSSATLWTLVNRSGEDRSGRELTVFYHGETFYDLWNGMILLPEIQGQTATLSFPMENRGFGAILALNQAPSDEVSSLLSKARDWAKTPISSLSSDWNPLAQSLVSIAATKLSLIAPTGMVLIPATNHFRFKVSGVEIEQDQRKGVDVQYPWEKEALVQHDHVLSIPAFYLDQEPVSNSDFARFLADSRYAPADSHHFLNDWPDWKNGIYPEGDALRPVTWVSLEDARAYAAWAGKRLPHEWEWQYAAQGTDLRLYPWGNDWNTQAVPAPQTGRIRGVPSVNGSFPEGVSPFGVMDLVGNIWQWTDEFTDLHTRAAVLRGGSAYQPQGSKWYFPQAYRLDQHGKYLLMAPSIDRSGEIGFRCAADAAKGS